MPSDVIPFMVDVSVDTTKSEAVEIPDYAKRFGLFIPALNANGAVSMECLLPQHLSASALLPSSDTNWKVIRDQNESTIVAASGIENILLDITEFGRHLPAMGYLRFVCVGTQVADSTWYMIFRG